MATPRIVRFSVRADIVDCDGSRKTITRASTMPVEFEFSILDMMLKTMPLTSEVTSEVIRVLSETQQLVSAFGQPAVDAAQPGAPIGT